MHEASSLVLLTGFLLLISLLLQLSVKERYIPHFILYLLIGVTVTRLDLHYPFLSASTLNGLRFLSEIGIIILLFKVGIHCNIRELRNQLPSALSVWISNVLISGLFGYIAAFYLLSLNWITSSIISVAFMATSIGVTVTMWEQERLLKTKKGETLLDVAELDDITSILLLTLLFAALPTLSASSDLHITLSQLGAEAGWLLLKLGGFIGGLVFFSLKIEPNITPFLRRQETQHELTVFIVAAGIIIAGIAEALGLSLAIGAFFAGLSMGRDNQLVKEAVALPVLTHFFIPFFFIGIGLHLTVPMEAVLTLSTVVLLLAAILGKLIGSGVPAYFHFGLFGAACIGISMIPRAEITLIVVQKALERQYIDDAVFSSVVIVAALTTLITPLMLHWLLNAKFARSESKTR